MTATHSLSLDGRAGGRRRALGLGAATSRADIASVYFNDKNAAAGGTLLPNGVGEGYNVGLGPTVMPNLTTGFDNTAIGADR
jgi:hypothetical protein